MGAWYIDQRLAQSEETDSFIGQYGTGKLRNSWSDVTWTPGDIYAQAAGIEVSEQIAPGSSGTSGNPITIRKYGLGLPNPVVGIGQSNGIYLNTRQYIDVFDVNVARATGHGVYVRSGGGSNLQSIRFFNVDSSKNGNNGFYLDSIVLNGSINNVLFDGCSGFDNLEHGFNTMGVVKTVYWKRCRAARNGASVLGHGFSLHPFVSNNIASGWTATGTGTSYQRTLAANETVQKVINRTSGVTLTKAAGVGASVANGQWDQSGTTLYVNVGVDANTRTMAWKRAAHGPFFYESCLSWDNKTDAGPGEGHGFASDDMTGPTTYTDCFAWGNEGAGFQSQWSDDVVMRNCFSWLNALSNFRTTGHTNNLTIEQCVALLGAEHGFFFDQPHSGVTIRNSIAFRNALYGIIAASSGVTASNNLTYGNGSGHTNTVTNANAVLADPLFVDVNRPWTGLSPSSPCRGAGTYIQGARDRFGRRYVERNIGPWAVLEAA